MPKGRPPKQTEVPKMVKHIRYELEVFALSYERVMALPDDADYPVRVERAAIANALYVSLRALIDFFNNKRGSFDTGMRADDYCTWNPASHGGALWPSVLSHKVALNERVAHISVERERPHGKALLPDFPELRFQLDDVLRHFHRQLPAPYRSEFHASLDDALKHVHAADRQGKPTT